MKCGRGVGAGGRDTAQASARAHSRAHAQAAGGGSALGNVGRGPPAPPRQRSASAAPRGSSGPAGRRVRPRRRAARRLPPATAPGRPRITRRALSYPLRPSRKFSPRPRGSKPPLPGDPAPLPHSSPPPRSNGCAAASGGPRRASYLDGGGRGAARRRQAGEQPGHPSGLGWAHLPAAPSLRHHVTPTKHVCAPVCGGGDFLILRRRSHRQRDGKSHLPPPPALTTASLSPAKARGRASLLSCPARELAAAAARCLPPPPARQRTFQVSTTAVPLS